MTFYLSCSADRYEIGTSCVQGSILSIILLPEMWPCAQTWIQSLLYSGHAVKQDVDFPWVRSTNLMVVEAISLMPLRRPWMLQSFMNLWLYYLIYVGLICMSHCFQFPFYKTKNVFSLSSSLLLHSYLLSFFFFYLWPTF